MIVSVVLIRIGESTRREMHTLHRQISIYMVLTRKSNHYMSRQATAGSFPPRTEGCLLSTRKTTTIIEPPDVRGHSHGEGNDFGSDSPTWKFHKTRRSKGQTSSFVSRIGSPSSSLLAEDCEPREAKRKRKGGRLSIIVTFSFYYTFLLQ